ncbi:MAG TPA: FAD-dependent oxidoreductase [Anaerolineales bacterium]|nr:FAD-dependent oxidoreductase [Anaerolineales bacterium]
MKYVIIGMGVAGIAAIEAIRSADSTGQITLVGDDPDGFYSRPGLAYYLTGELNDKALYPRTAEDYHRMNFRYVSGRVIGVQREKHLIELDNKTQIPYDKLLIVVGAQSISMDIPGASLDGVLKLDHMEDAKRILNYARRGRTAVVIGGGITALELVEGLVSRGVKVHYLLRGERYWSNVLDEQESQIVEHRLKEEGVTLHYHIEVGEVIGKHGRVGSVRLLSGQTIKCDLVAYAIGVRPRLELAKQAQLKTDRGILVNEYLQTSDPDIYAAGDVAQVFDPRSGRSVLDSLWGAARGQGYAAGLNMAGKQKAYIKPVAFNVTRLAGLTTTIIGNVGQGRDSDLIGIARGDSETWRQSPDAMVAQTGFEVNRLRLVVGEKTLIGAIIMGDQKLSFPLEKIISRNTDISSIRQQLLMSNAKIGDILSEFWAGIKNQSMS